jgi:2,4-dienoyl-CoA reductase-like NADH-dependent reductase (Old Yellow Enzyme family)
MSSPVSVRHHPYLDRSVGPPPDQPLLGDDEIYGLIETYVTAVGLAAEAGFDFVDLKACHGYLGHELLGAFERAGDFGGSFENRVRFLTTIASMAKAAVPGIRLTLRLSAFDTVTHVADEDGVGRPITEGNYRYWFGTDETGHTIDLAEPVRLLTMMQDTGVNPVCITGSSPYNARHLQRPALNVSPGEYLPPEDPLVGVARHLEVTRRLKGAVPGLVVVGSGYSYLQQWVPNVAQAVVRSGGADIVGLGRLHLASPTVPSDVLSGRGLDTEKIWASF